MAERIGTAAKGNQADRSEWHGVRLHAPDWSPASHSLAFTARGWGDGLVVHGMLNAYWEALEFELPAADPCGPWMRWLDTALESPQDIVRLESAAEVHGERYRVEARSIAILCSVRVTTRES